MDEQTIQQPISEEISQPEFDSQLDTMDDDSSYQDDSTFDEPLSAPQEDLGESEVAVDDSGEVSFSDDFFGDVKDEPEQEPLPYYSDEELQNTPYEQWDFNRMPEPVKQYMNALNQQTMARQRQQAIQQRQPPQFLNEVKQYTPRELAQESQKLAIEQLGIDEDDFDEYEPEHQAALTLAQNELLQKRNAEVRNYQRNIGEYNQLQAFNQRLAAQPDFKDFDAWHSARLRTKGLTQQQIDAGLMQLANDRGFGAVQQVLGEWYREFQAERGRHRGFSRARNLRPPVLEGTRGGDSADRSYNMRNFGEMDSDAQARALMDMGIV